LKITSIYASPLNYDNELFLLNDIIKSTLLELDVNIVEFNILSLDLPYFNGTLPPQISQITDDIKSSDGIIFISTVHLFSPCAIMQTFLDYLSSPTCKNLLDSKNCLIALASRNGGEKFAIDYISKIINSLGGFDAVKIPINSEVIKNMEINMDIRLIIERQIEDFYRIIKQNRIFFISSETNTGTTIPTSKSNTYEINQAQSEILQKVSNDKKISIEKVYAKYNLSTLNDNQERDVSEITQFFSKRLTEVDSVKDQSVEYTEFNDNLSENSNYKTLPNDVLKNIHPVDDLVMSGHSFFNENLDNIDKNEPIVPKNKTCKQITSTLPHRFLPQFSKGLNTVIQLTVSGDEQFECSITIANTECFYEEGVFINPDITIVADSIVWLSILKGVQTAQKAFMVGQLKVRGNFVILTKFDQLFTNSN
jgi:putative sterol carrier protein/NAD(P)H-dependent FMN reductase